MEGFLSTSLDESAALGHFQRFRKNTLIQINVKIDNLKGPLDWGFANIKEWSRYSAEEEVLFNPINIFKVCSCNSVVKKPFQIGDELSMKYVVLEFGVLTELFNKVNAGESVSDI